MKDSTQTRVTILLSSALLLTAVVVSVLNSNGSQTSKFASAAPGNSSTNLKTKSPVPGDATINSPSEDISVKAKYPATTRLEAVKQARLSAGRMDPMQGINAEARYLPLEEKHTSSIPNTESSDEQTQHIAKERLVVPPPPPMPVSTRSSESERISTHTPQRRWRDPVQSALANVRLTAVIGNKAMLSLRREGSSRAERPEVICLAAGEQTKTVDNVNVSVISVDKDRVVFEVGGDRIVRSLPEIR